MPKRKKETPHDDNSKIEKYLRKIRRIKQKRRRSRSSTNSDYSIPEEYHHTDAIMSPTEKSVAEHILYESEDGSSRKEDVPSQFAPPQSPQDISEVTLDDDTLLALGKPVKEKKKYGPNINGDLAKLWLPILKNGLGDFKERQQILEKYLVPHNCQLLQAPKLNTEIVATVTDSIRNRDKKIEEEQQQLGHGLTALNKALTLLATNTGERGTIINTLSEASQILCDLHYTQTQARKKLITPILDKKFLDLVKDTQRGEFLYGNYLSEKIKAMKYAQKSSHSIRKSNDNYNYKNFKKSTYGQGNYRGPPRFHQQKPYNRSGPKRPSDRSSNYKPHHSYSYAKKKTEVKTPAAQK